MSTASAKTAPKKLRLDFTPSEMGMLMGITLRIPEPELKAQWEAFLKRVVYIEAQPDAERTALETENLHLMMLVERVANTLRMSLPSLIHPEDWGEFREAGWEPLQNLLNELDTLQGEKFPEIDAQERTASKSIDEEPLAIRDQDVRTSESEIDAQERTGA